MRTRLVSLLFLAVLLAALTPLESVLAARGAPGSTDFGFGAHLNLNGQFAIEGVRLASDLQLDWVGVDLSWQTVAPKAGSVDWTRLDPIMDAAARSQLSVMVSLTEAPDWALTAHGPSPEKTAQFAVQLVNRYPQAVQAIELFPAANTLRGWGQPPDPQAFMVVLSSVMNALSQSNLSVQLVGGGLKPVLVGPDDNAQDIDDVSFLQSLYQYGFGKAVSIVSIQANDLTGDPLQAPDKSENRVLRHYDTIRQVMLDNGHEGGLIWITHLAPPDGSINPDDKKYQDPAFQSGWYEQAYNQLKSQLYIGVAFFSGLNPSDSDPSVTLIQRQGNYHPFYRTLRELISANRSDQFGSRPGRAKDKPLRKS